MIKSLTIILAVVVGYLLRDLRVKSIQKKTQEIKKKVFPNKSEVLDWKPPKTIEEENEEEAKKNMEL